MSCEALGSGEGALQALLHLIWAQEPSLPFLHRQQLAALEDNTQAQLCHTYFKGDG